MIFAEIHYKQQNCKNGIVCGDRFTCKHIHDNSHTIMILADGMGYGVKANKLSKLFSETIIIELEKNDKDLTEIIKSVIKNPPTADSEKISYSAFTVIEINHITDVIKIAEYDNPHTIIIRGNKPIDCEWITEELDSPYKKNKEKIRHTNFKAEVGDRIVFMTDGVTQSGIGSDLYPFGWGDKNVEAFVFEQINESISSEELANRIILRSVENDEGLCKDDISCIVLSLTDSDNNKN